MPRLNPWDLPRPETVVETRTFRDPSQPEAEIRLTLRGLGPFEISAIARQSEDLRATWDGNTMPLPDGSTVEIDTNTCNIIAALMAMEVPAPGESAGDMLWWIGVAIKFPSAWSQIVLWCNQMLEHGHVPGGLGPKAAGA